MFEDSQICPYAGLRSFTEEESLYFKGREEHIEQATQQLQQNKFLMLTGASGDGKSSLIYAGIVPNARAGFLKSKYSRWLVADFRPERSPFKNLCKALSRQLEIVDQTIVESELKHGFSSLIDLYQNSKFYIDKGNNSESSAQDKRQAANLMIIVDQFEEFFTNPENYHQGVPSQDATLVLNILLETARLALEDDIPIYIVFTMRSDYIGQCAAFRSLPEYIGFSQFFVPRLNRSQLQQVIEQPAVLSGNRITRRLTERLIHDIADGVDQLPILQHALNQIWHAASNGGEEMDLLHYAMVSGMPWHELPDEQGLRYEAWFAGLAPEIQKCFHRQSLQNVLDTHANKLYESAEENYFKQTGRTIPDSDSKLIIKTTFSCLTKIDQSRAVRNRMTLGEIRDIIGREDLDHETIGKVLNTFREPGNTFIRPFITDDPKSTSLDSDDVLDITHESLIRNWDALKSWAVEENSNYMISQDFEKQLDRWVTNEKSSDFLLSMGPLTYFENWFNQAKPNASWVGRYLPTTGGQESKLKVAKTILDNSREFFSKSIKKHIVTRTIVRLGPKRIAAVLAALLVIGLSSFAVVNQLQKRNSVVLKKITTSSLRLAANKKIGPEFTGHQLLQLIQSGVTTIPEVIQSIPEPDQQLLIANTISKIIVIQGKQHPIKEITEALENTDRLLEERIEKSTLSTADLNVLLKETGEFRVVLGLADLQKSVPGITEMIAKNARRSSKLCLLILQSQPQDFTDIRQLTLNLENALNYQTLSPDQIRQILSILSPWEADTLSRWHQARFKPSEFQERGTTGYSMSHNGLYQELAYLYASLGEVSKALYCVDILINQNQNYHENNFTSFPDNANQIAYLFYTNGHEPKGEEFIKKYCLKKNISPVEFYRRFIARQLTNYAAMDNLNLYGVTGKTYSNLSLIFSHNPATSYYSNALRKEIQNTLKGDELNFELANAYKNESAILSYRKILTGKLSNDTFIDSLMGLAMTHYFRVNKNYLQSVIPIVFTTSTDNSQLPRKYLFLFPDHRETFNPFEPRSFYYPYHSTGFLEYVLKNNLFDSLYSSREDLVAIEGWLANYHLVSCSRDYFFRPEIPYELLQTLAQKLETLSFHRQLDLNPLYLYLTIEAAERNLKDTAVAYFSKMKPEYVLNLFGIKGFDFVNSYSMERFAVTFAYLYNMGAEAQVAPILNVFKNHVNRSQYYAYAAQTILKMNGDKNTAIRLIDSAKAEMSRVDNPAVFQPNKILIAIAHEYLANPGSEQESYRLIKNVVAKFSAFNGFIWAKTSQNKWYEAYQVIPQNISDEDLTVFLFEMTRAINHQAGIKPEWKSYEANLLFANRYFIAYINENN